MRLHEYRVGSLKHAVNGTGLFPWSSWKIREAPLAMSSTRWNLPGKLQVATFWVCKMANCIVHVTSMQHIHTHFVNNVFTMLSKPGPWFVLSQHIMYTIPLIYEMYWSSYGWARVVWKIFTKGRPEGTPGIAALSSISGLLPIKKINYYIVHCDWSPQKQDCWLSMHRKGGKCEPCKLNPMFTCSAVARSVASNVQLQWSESTPVYKTGKLVLETIVISWVNVHTQDTYTLLQTNMAVYRCLLRSISCVALMLMALFIFGRRDRKRARCTTRRYADSDPAVSPSGSPHCKNTIEFNSWRPLTVLPPVLKSFLLLPHSPLEMAWFHLVAALWPPHPLLKITMFLLLLYSPIGMAWFHLLAALWPTHPHC